VDIELGFTDKEITAWGGLQLMRRMLEHIGWDKALANAGLPQPQSNRGYAPEQLVNQFMLSIWCGANRFEHMEVTRYDAVLGRLFGYERMANYKAFTRLIDKCDQASISGTFAGLYTHLFDQVGLTHLTLDLDSTVLTRYGQQQGAARGYNPTKRGRASHHPLMAFVPEARMVANVWLRPGNAGTAHNAIAFLQETAQHRLGPGKQVGLVRADSGFCANAFLQHLESTQTHYAVAMRLNRSLQAQLVTQRWWPLDRQSDCGIEVCEFAYRADSWAEQASPTRRVIGVRQSIKSRPNARGKSLSLFADDPDISGWRYGAIVTDLKLPAGELWRLYRGRADCENRIKELKYDFALGTLVRRDFWATEAALHWVMMAYNLMSLFRVAMSRQLNRSGAAQTLASLRQKLFAQPGFIACQGRVRPLKLATAMQRRLWMTGLWESAKSFDLPITVQPIFVPDS
jgi:hypothetical protein